MKKLLVLALCSSSAASAVTLSNVTLNSALGNRLSVPQLKLDVTFPAAFPKPSVTTKFTFNCRDGLEVLGDDDDGRYAKASGARVTKTSFQLGTLKASCEGMKLTVSDPRLMKWWTSSRTDPEMLDLDVHWSAQPPRPLAWTPKKDALAIDLGAFDLVTYTLRNGRISVLDGPSHGAISVTQGGKPQPLWVDGGLRGSLKLDLRKPFTLHVTNDEGQTWDNLTINLAANSVSRWGSLQQAGGPMPREE
ncbi:hypothetical protein E5F05_00560 (plasmid) [Deinococcus metallilatus]|uniref:Uncharacterized protein n=1 Tax=Deinococcus metallilatus TaxID=1211322 RepID=A0AAJ5JZT1_9DEIO|nr:hypothetical protein [Deinococcus metallilatus]MBB5293394.1 hypothetical protein [Deinococcus metallilatus]QBY06489.1 hypothetical protein E5F05_00560 [Deinococcus metallilatus]RXJ17832.1 hypothetical protein ERJ73_00170 [Deinococcus metallilatus]TLK32104.1 hypothetical protein FCS05_01190 [Deinococcus metallilatus]GMA15386.1 hypothetical protein GCM10025871_17170 [Deinococcus metallilatus]